MTEQMIDRQSPTAAGRDDDARSTALDRAWARCRTDRMDRATARPLPGERQPGDGHLLDTVSATMAGRAADIDRSGGAVVLTNAAGTVLGRWGVDDVLHTLDEIDCRVGMSMAETAVGASSFSTLVTGEPVTACGPEHFATRLISLASTGTAIRQAPRRRIAGSLHLLTHVVDDNPIALSWIEELVRGIEADLADPACRGERMLMDRYLAENRDSRHAVVAISEQTIITNAAAARLVGIEEQSILWERARQLTRSQTVDERQVDVGDGHDMQVRFIPVLDGETTVGMILRLRRTAPAAPTPAESLPGLVGSSGRWQDLCRTVSGLAGASLLLVGESGTGKTAIAAAISDGAESINAMDGIRIGWAEWLERLRAILAESPPRLVVTHLDRLPSAISIEVTRLLGDAMATTRVVATARPQDGRIDPTDVLGLFGSVVTVPPLRDRIEDLPALVRELTRRYTAAYPERGRVQWMTDALQALSRTDHPHNVASLQHRVFSVLQATTAAYIGVHDLPAAAVVDGSRRRLAGLDRVEAAALVQALRDARGNKRKAADSLGIARSTLYRKMRALGIDLEASTS
ncbi:helix-turn-helix domain-containing protein [Gordonia shandongensis]|uniref:helix-turn-helix domain-containing protein n=1 Tax=Gordonia shandongensis TaxID=376351 RepID=UPI0003F4B1B1|nr:helix-turn-helix domain-containing protein [Gordonia shandongensis]